MILAIDPGNIESAYVLVDDNYKPVEFAKVSNAELLDMMDGISADIPMAIEMVASYGMAVGKEIFDTVFWAGRFWQKAECARKTQIYRQAVKLNLCHDIRAKDSNITQALKDRFGGKGTKKNPGWFYGFSKDVWQAYALAVTYLDKVKAGEITEVSP